MSVVSMKQLLEAGVHFGHQTRRWNPKMAPYIYMERNGIYIIDLQKTVRKLEDAYNFIRDVSETGGNVLFVGTKKQAQDAIKEEAERVGMFFVNARWLGGMLTNFKTMRMRIDRLAQLRKMQEDGTFDILPKKEVIKLTGEINRLEKYLGGVKEMKKLPAALFIIDPRKERNAIAEARKLGIPIVAIVDTNCDPDEIDYIIPGNDDAIRAIRLIAQAMANAVIEGRQGFEAAEALTQAESAPAASADAPPVAVSPLVDAPAVEVPVEKPVAKAPAVKAPVVEEPVVDTPVVDISAAEPPVVDAPPAEPTAVQPAKKATRKTTKKAEDVPVDIKEDVPVKAKKEAPAKAEEEAPAKAEDKVPVKAKKETSAKAKEDAPVKTKKEVPAETKVKAPVKTKKETTADAKEETPADAPKKKTTRKTTKKAEDTPVEAAEKAPAEVKEEVPADAPVKKTTRKTTKKAEETPAEAAEKAPVE